MFHIGTIFIQKLLKIRGKPFLQMVFRDNDHLAIVEKLNKLFKMSPNYGKYKPTFSSCAFFFFHLKFLNILKKILINIMFMLCFLLMGSYNNTNISPYLNMLLLLLLKLWLSFSCLAH